MTTKPVAVLTTVVTLLAALDALLTGAHVVNPTLSAWIAGATAAVTLLLGSLAHRAVTPLANPRNSDGQALVPAGPAR